MKVLVYFWENTQPVHSYLVLLALLVCSLRLNEVASMVPFTLIILNFFPFKIIHFSTIGMGMNPTTVEMKLVAMNIIQLSERKMSYKFKTEANIDFSSNLSRSAQS